MTRTPKSRTERAQQALGVAQRRYDKAAQAERAARAALTDAQGALAEADRLLTYAAGHPDLPQPAEPTEAEADDGAIPPDDDHPEQPRCLDKQPDTHDGRTG